MKKKTEFKVGDRVGLNVSMKYRDHYDDNPQKTTLVVSEDEDPCYGKITSLNEGKAEVEWDEENNTLDYLEDKIDVKDLLPEKDMKEKYSQLEKDFKQLEKDIKAKLKEAAKLIKEAQKLADKQGQTVADMYDAYSPLYDAMDAAGWRTSSFGC
jgi:hypothetical protein